jgi:hypothetical protein
VIANSTSILHACLIYGTILSNVPIATHLGMKRGKTVNETLEHTVNENIQKARWTAYT